MYKSIALVLLACVGLSGCIGSKYAAEVGYKSGGETKWDIWGSYSSLDDCRNAAIARYNQYFQENRAVSWACLKKNGEGGYKSRHR